MTKIIKIRPEDIHFSPREKEVMLLLVDGKTDEQAGIILHINPKTVNTYRSHALSEIGALIGYRPSMAEVVQIFLAMGFIKNKFKKKRKKRVPVTK